MGGKNLILIEWDIRKYFSKRLKLKNLFKLIFLKIAKRKSLREDHTRLSSRCWLSLPTTYVDWRKHPWVVFLNCETTEVAFVHLRRQSILVIHFNATWYQLSKHSVRTEYSCPERRGHFTNNSLCPIFLTSFVQPHKVLYFYREPA